MIPLSDIFHKNGFTYTQVLRDERKTIYRQDVPPDLTCYEVFRIQVGRERTFKGQTIPIREMYLGNEEFGGTAWTCQTLADAMLMYNNF